MVSWWSFVLFLPKYCGFCPWSLLPVVLYYHRFFLMVVTTLYALILAKIMHVPISLDVLLMYFVSISRIMGLKIGLNQIRINQHNHITNLPRYTAITIRNLVNILHTDLSIVCNSDAYKTTYFVSLLCLKVRGLQVFSCFVRFLAKQNCHKLRKVYWTWQVVTSTSINHNLGTLKRVEQPDVDINTRICHIKMAKTFFFRDSVFCLENRQLFSFLLLKFWYLWDVVESTYKLYQLEWHSFKLYKQLSTSCRFIDLCAMKEIFRNNKKKVTDWLIWTERWQTDRRLILPTTRMFQQLCRVSDA